MITVFELPEEIPEMVIESPYDRLSKSSGIPRFEFDIFDKLSQITNIIPSNLMEVNIRDLSEYVDYKILEIPSTVQFETFKLAKNGNPKDVDVDSTIFIETTPKVDTLSTVKTSSGLIDIVSTADFTIKVTGYKRRNRRNIKYNRLTYFDYGSFEDQVQFGQVTDVYNAGYINDILFNDDSIIEDVVFENLDSAKAKILETITTISKTNAFLDSFNVTGYYAEFIGRLPIYNVNGIEDISHKLLAEYNVDDLDTDIIKLFKSIYKDTINLDKIKYKYGLTELLQYNGILGHKNIFQLNGIKTNSKLIEELEHNFHIDTLSRQASANRYKYQLLINIKKHTAYELYHKPYLQLNDKLRKIIDNKSNTIMNHVLSKTKCEHIELYHELMNAFDNRRKADTKRLISELESKFANKEFNMDDINMCKSCNSQLICPHQIEMIRDFIENGNVDSKQYIEHITTFYSDSDTSFNNASYCKICGELIFEKNMAIGFSIQGPDILDHHSATDELDEILFNEVRNLLRYIKIKSTVDIKFLAKNIAYAINPEVKKIELRTLRSRILDRDTAKNIIKVYIAIYALSGIIYLAFYNPGTIEFKQLEKHASSKSKPEAKSEPESVNPAEPITTEGGREKANKSVKRVKGEIHVSRKYLQELFSVAYDILIMEYKTFINHSEILNRDNVKQIMLAAYKYISSLSFTQSSDVASMDIPIYFDAVQRYASTIGKLENNKNYMGIPYELFEKIITGKSSDTDPKEAYTHLPIYKDRPSFNTVSYYINNKVYAIANMTTESTNEYIESQLKDAYKNHIDQKKLGLRNFVVVDCVPRKTKIDTPDPNLTHIYCQSGSKHKLGGFIFKIKGKLVRLTKDEYLAGCKSSDKDIMTSEYVDKYCSICNKNYNDKGDTKILLSNLEKNSAINAFYDMYNFKCPEGNIHDFNDKQVCTKCKYDKNDNHSEAYYKKYKSVYEKHTVTKTRHVTYIAEIYKHDKLDALEKEIDIPKNWTKLYADIAKLSKVINIPYLTLFNLGNLDTSTELSDNPIVTNKRVGILKSHIIKLCKSLSIFKYSDPATAPKDIKEYILSNKKKSINFSLLPIIEANKIYDMISRYQLLINSMSQSMDPTSDEFLDINLKLCNFIMSHIVKIIFEIVDVNSNFVEFARYLVDNLIAIEESHKIIKADAGKFVQSSSNADAVIDEELSETEIKDISSTNIETEEIEEPTDLFEEAEDLENEEE